MADGAGPSGRDRQMREQQPEGDQSEAAFDRRQMRRQPYPRLRNLGMAKPVSRPSIKSNAPMKQSVEERDSIVLVSEITDPRSVSRDLPTLSLFVNRTGREDDQPGPTARRHHRRYYQRSN